VPSLRLLIAGFSLRRTRFAPRLIYVEFMMNRVGLGQVFLQVLGFPLSVSFCSCSVFTHRSSGGWTKTPLEGLFHRDIVSLDCSCKNKISRDVATYLPNMTVSLMKLAVKHLFHNQCIINDKYQYHFFLCASSFPAEH
jgi:hypothetical protein